MRINSLQPNITFRAKDVTLFTDFDGTMLQQSLKSVGNDFTGEVVQGYNDYFQAFDDLRSERNGKFKVFITTGRRLEGEDGHGFLRTYNFMRENGIRMPKLDGIITSEGGDIFQFMPNGDIDKTPSAQKRQLVKERTGWDLEKVRKTLRKISEKLGVNFRQVDEKSFHKLSIVLDDNRKLGDFYDELAESLKHKEISGKAKISTHVKDGDRKVPGIKIGAKYCGSSIHKDFDVKEALEAALRERDFVIVAGNESNDKELLDLFRYGGSRKGWRDYMGMPEKDKLNVLDRIKKLPIGVIFVDAPAEAATQKQKDLREFMIRQQELFPDKVLIVERSQFGGENTLVSACRELIEKHFGRKPEVPVATGVTGGGSSSSLSTAASQASESVKSAKGKGGYIAAALVAAVALGGSVYYFNHNKKD